MNFDESGQRARMRWLAAGLVGVVCVGLAAHIWSARYYLRFVPLPLSVVDWVDSGSALIPSYQDGTARGDVDLGPFDLSTDAGVRSALNDIRAFSPLLRVSGMSLNSTGDFASWLQSLRTNAMLCTDATQMFILAAWKSGYKAREWHLVPPGWPVGQGHSMAEFFNPRTGRWQVVDAQHAAILRDRTDGRPLAMTDVLRRFKDKARETIRFDYGPYQKAVEEKAAGSTETYLFDVAFLNTPILQLRQATWFAAYPRVAGLSGHFVIGYPIVVDGWTHDSRVLWTKVSLLALLVGLGIGMRLVWLAVTGRRSGRP